MRIGIAFSLKPADAATDGPDDRYEEFDKPETVEAIAEVIRGEGHDVALLGDGREFLEKVLRDPPEFVFNIAEGHGVGRNREARVPAVCEMLDIPYSGSDPLTLAASLDKSVAKQLASSEEVPTAWANILIPPGTDPAAIRERYLARDLREPWSYPVILKPAYEGSSKGIRGRCVADTEDQVVAIYAELARDYAQPILVEGFVRGDEVTVGVIGNGESVAVLGAMRIAPKRPTERFVYSLEVKRDWANQVDYEAPARLDATVQDNLFNAARAAYANLGCRDVARIDFRLMRESRHPYFIEANPLPGLAPGTSDLVILAEGHGIGHGELVRLILHAALERVGLIDVAGLT